MKTLFLASYFAFVSDLLLPLLPKKPNELRLAFIPTAADPYKIKPWFYGDKMKLKLMGFNMIDVDIKNKTKEQLITLLKDIDVIFVSGGNTYYLLEKAQESGFLEIGRELVEGGVLYIGSSAGSALACPTIEHIEDFDDKSITCITDFKGLGFTRKLILPHFGEEKYKSKFENIIERWISKKYEVLPLRNNQALVIQGDKEEVFTANSH
ncbi:MAG: Type 1 glutamine amidotransferase-like domain-containing protein [Candidatus Roizmanbacteria bacterium]|nr:Type 1 glutamine amidotransferase-like domain-containing protein [Candidatus Roizmanbacteria bacterium]